MALVLLLATAGCAPSGPDGEAVAVSTTSQAVLACQQPYGGAVRAIPGTIEAEHYDLGGEGCAYHDTTAGNAGQPGGNTLRNTESVDLQAASEAGWNVGWVKVGEWLRYTVNVTTAGKYKLELRTATTGGGKSVDVLMESTIIADNLAVPVTASYQTYATVTVPEVTLSAGVQSLQVTFNSDSLNLNWIRFTFVGCTAETDAAFCARLGKNCGAVSGTDNCGAARTVPSCGPCDAPGICTAANVCCTVESDAAFCARLGKNCGAVTAADSCGTSRTADCGACTAPDTCSTSNVCCAGETDAAFCARLGKNCGAVTGNDVCGVGRTVDCGACTSPSVCSSSNVCQTPVPGCLRTVPVSGSAALAAAITAALPGDCLMLADGNYSFPTISKTGTADALITIKAVNRGLAVVNSGVLHLKDSSYVVLEGLDITSTGGANPAGYINGGSNGLLVAFNNSNNCRLTRTRIHPSGTHVTDRDWIVLTGAGTHHNRIDHNDLGPLNVVANMLVIDGTGQEEPLIPGNVSQFNQVDHNYFHDITGAAGNNKEAIRVGRSWQGPTGGFNVIEHNLLKAASGDPETVSVKSSDNTIRYNTMRATAGEFTSRHGNRNHFYGNYILGVDAPDANGSSRGFRIYGTDHRIFNNYVHAASTGIWLDDGGSAAESEPGKEHYRVARTWVFNNIVINKNIQIGGSKPFPPINCRVANNILTGAGRITVADTTIVKEGNLEGGTNPLTLQSGVYRLLANSAGALAIDRAVNPAFYFNNTGGTDNIADIDLQGQPRAVTDIGADESSTAPVTIAGPLTTTDVGPASP